MELETYINVIIMSISMFLISLLYLGSTIPPEQAKRMKHGEPAVLTFKQALAINIAQLCFYIIILSTVWKIGQVLAIWLNL